MPHRCVPASRHGAPSLRPTTSPMAARRTCAGRAERRPSHSAYAGSGAVRLRFFRFGKLLCPLAARHLPSGGMAGEKDGAEVEPRRRCAGRAILTASPVQRGHLVDRGEDVELRAREAAAALGVCRIILRHPGVFYAQRRDGSERRRCRNLGGRRREGGEEGGGAGRLAGPLWLPEAAVEVDEEREGAVARRDVKDRVVCLAAARGGG